MVKLVMGKCSNCIHGKFRGEFNMNRKTLLASVLIASLMVSIGCAKESAELNDASAEIAESGVSKSEVGESSDSESTDAESSTEIVDQTKYQTFTAKELQEDIDYLFKEYEEIHPNLYAYVDESEVKYDIEELKSQITGPMNLKDFSKALNPVVANIKDGHTRVKIETYIKGHFNDNRGTKGVYYLPFTVSCRDQKIYIDDSLEAYIPVGVEILSINGVSRDEIYKETIKHMPGFNPAFNEVKLEGKFPMYYWLEFGSAKEYEIIYLCDGENIATTVPSYTYRQYADLQYVVSQDKSDDFWYKIENDTCYLEFNVFSDYNLFDSFLVKMFTEIEEKGVENLVIDIRKNGGGNSMLGNLLFSYIYEDGFRMWSRCEVKISEQLRSQRDYADYHTGNIGEVLNFDSEFYRTAIEHPFDGNVFVLIGRRSFSSASDFAALVKDNNAGVLIGEKTGGLVSNYGDFVSIKLPNTGIKASSSFRYFVRPNGDTTLAAVAPDFEVFQTLADTENGADTVLESVTKMIEEDTVMN